MIFATVLFVVKESIRAVLSLLLPEVATNFTMSPLKPAATKSCDEVIVLEVILKSAF